MISAFIAVFVVFSCLVFFLMQAKQQVRELQKIQADRNAAEQRQEADFLSRIKVITEERDKIKAEYETLRSDYNALRLATRPKPTESARAGAGRPDAESARAAKALEEARMKKAQAEAQDALQKANEERELYRRSNYTTPFSYEILSETPEKLIDKKIRFQGRVAQVIEDVSNVRLRIATNGNNGDVVLVSYEPSVAKSKIREGDMVTAYGVSRGPFTYRSTEGESVTVPFFVVYILENMTSTG
ncbi:MAG: hypothetical protein LBQ19_03495 [Synergistaceae bacterium]|jgi:hypothetical protein|nr:hypothetical protein [Synergistaceae bacterium]